MAPSSAFTCLLSAEQTSKAKKVACTHHGSYWILDKHNPRDSCFHPFFDGQKKRKRVDLGLSLIHISEPTRPY